MAQQSATVEVEGRVTRTERKSGSFTDREDPTRTVTYDFQESRLVTADLDVVQVRFPVDGSIPIPPADEVVRLRCEARAAGGNIKLTVTSVQRALVGV